MTEQRYNESFYATPYSLHQHPLWTSAKHHEKEVFRVIQFRSAVCEMDYDNNGLTIRLKRGQCCISYTQLALEANTSVKKARGAVNHFRGYERRGKKLLHLSCNATALLRTQQKAQLGAQQKGVIDILLDGYFINEDTAKGTAKGMAKGRPVAHEGHTNKEAKKLEEPFQETPPPPTPPIKSGGGGEGKRKSAFAYDGKISKEATALHNHTVRNRMPISEDRIQQWFDDYPKEIVEMHIQQTHETILAGKIKIISPPLWVGAKLNEHKKGQKIEKIMETPFQKNKRLAEFFYIHYCEEVTKNQEMKITQDFFIFNGVSVKVKIAFSDDAFEKNFEEFRVKFIEQVNTNNQRRTQNA